MATTLCSSVTFPMGFPARKIETRPAAPIETGIHVLEHVVGLDKVKNFLRKELLQKKQDAEAAERGLNVFCEQNVCNLWRVEPHLMAELVRHGDKDERDRLRQFIYAVSWRSHARPEPQQLRAQENYLTTFIKQSSNAARGIAKRMETGAEDERHGEQKDDKEDLRKAEAIQDAVEDQTKIGASLQKAVDAIEDFMQRAYEQLGVDLRHHGLNWSLLSTALPSGQDMEHVNEDELRNAITKKLYLPEKTKKETLVKAQILDDLIAIQRLRGLRDYLYFKYLYPHWLNARP